MATKKKNERGANIVEFAFTLPLLMILLLGIFSFAVLLNNQLTLNSVVEMGAKQLTINRLLNPADACAAAQNYVLGTGGYSPSHATPLVAGNVTFSTPVFGTATYPATSTCTALVSGDMMQWTATYPCNLTIFGHNYFPGCTLSSTAGGRIE